MIVRSLLFDNDWGILFSQVCDRIYDLEQATLLSNLYDHLWDIALIVPSLAAKQVLLSSD